MMLPKMSEYVKCFDETKYMSFLIIKDHELFEACYKIWNRVSNLMRKEFDSGPAYYKNI